MRKLASIQKIVDVKKHPNADRLDIVTVLGWEIITQINQFKKDDYCVMFQCDSILPQHEIFDFLEKRKYRIRTQKLRGIISQGLVMPTSIIKTITGKTIELEEGKDVTELLGVIKHDPQAQKERTMQRKDPKRNPVVNYMLSFAWYRKLHYTYISKQKKLMKKEYKICPGYSKYGKELFVITQKNWTAKVLRMQYIYLNLECHFYRKYSQTHFTCAQEI